MDFKKFSRSSVNFNSLDYSLLKGMEVSFQEHHLISLKIEDVMILFIWRNQKINSLLPDHPLIGKEEEEFLASIKESLSLSQPDSIHLRLDRANELVGIAGFTEIEWQNLHAKTYFFLDPQKTEDAAQFGRNSSIILHLLMKCGFCSLGLNKISIETPGSEIMLVHTIEASGFKRETEFKDYTQINGRSVSMIYASCTKDNYFRVFPSP